MNLTWHIVKKDLRALKWPLLLWILLIVAKLGVGVLLLTADGTEGLEWFTRLDAMAKMLAAFEFVSFVLTAALIQQDLLVGTTAFWMTRPISGGRLLRAKLLSIGLVFGLAPLLVTLPWWLGCGYGGRELAWAAAETVAVQAIAVLLGLLWSVVTDGFARFLMWTLVTLFATPMLTGIIAYSFSRRKPAAFQELIATRFLLVVILAVVGVIIVVGHQFLTRRTWRSIALIGATGGLIVLTGAFWPWSWNLENRLYSYLIGRAEGEWPAAAEPPGLAYQLTSATLAAPADRPGRPGTFVSKYRVEGLTTLQALMPVPSEHAWRWPDGKSVTGRTNGRSGLAQMMWTRALAAGGNTAPGIPSADVLTFTSHVPASAIEKMHAAPARYTLPARFRLLRFESAERVPLQPGSRKLQDANGERIARVERDGAQLLVTYIQHTPSLWVDNVAGGPLAPTGEYSQYFLVNHAHDFAHPGSAAEYKLTRVGTVNIGWRTVAYHAVKVGPRPPAGRELLAAMGALNDAELIKVTFAEQARFSHELAIEPADIAKPGP